MMLSKKEEMYIEKKMGESSVNNSLTTIIYDYLESNSNYLHNFIYDLKKVNEKEEKMRFTEKELEYIVGRLSLCYESVRDQRTRTKRQIRLYFGGIDLFEDLNKCGEDL